jgi:hypothetical protein
MAAEVDPLAEAALTDAPAKAAGESEAHRNLKRLALIWAQSNGYRIAAAEVSLPNHRVRMDVAACKPQRVREPAPPESKTGRAVWRSTVGITAVFECKASKGDFVRDARSAVALKDKLAVLHQAKARTEEELKIHYPSIRNGDSLFQEFETLNFERPGYERYERIISEIRQLDSHLFANTKFDRLIKYKAANLFYVVAEPGLVSSRSLPCGWGLLERNESTLRLESKPIWHDVEEHHRLAFLQRISMAATRAVNRENSISYAEIGFRW